MKKEWRGREDYYGRNDYPLYVSSTYSSPAWEQGMAEDTAWRLDQRIQPGGVERR